MKNIVFPLLFVFSGNVHSESYKDLFNKIESGYFSFQTLSILVILDESKSMTGEGVALRLATNKTLTTNPPALLRTIALLF